MLEPDSTSLPAIQNAEQNDLNDLATGAAIALTGRLIGRILDLTRQAVLVRMISQADFGIYALAITIFRLVASISPLGLTTATVRFGAAHKHNPLAFGAVLRVGIGMSLLTGTGFGILLFLLADPIAVLIFSQPALAPVLRLFAIIVPVSAFTDVCLSTTTIKRRIGFAIGVAEVVQPALYLLGLILLAAALTHVYALTTALLAAAISFGIAALIAAWGVLRRFPVILQRLPYDRAGELPRAMIRFGMPGALASLMLWSSPLFDRLLIGIFSTAENAGIYVVVAQIATLFTLIAAAIASIQSPITAHIIQEGNTARLERVAQSAVRMGLLLGLPLLIILSVHSGVVLSLVFGPGYAVGGSALLLLSGASLVRVISDRAITLLVIAGHNRQWLLFSAAAFLLNVGLDALLIPKFGMVGSAIGTGIVNLFLLIVLAVATWKLLRIRLCERSVLRFIPITAASAAAGMLPFWLGVSLPAVPELLVFALLSASVFALLAWRFSLADDEKILLSGAFSRVSRIGKAR